MALRNECLHDQAFLCVGIRISEDDWQHGFMCQHQCGFWLNFSPSQAGAIREWPTPKDPSMDDWKLQTLSFHPTPRGAIKKLRPLSTYIA